MGQVVNLHKQPDERDNFDALREEWKTTPLKQEPFDYPLWWKSVTIWIMFFIGIFLIGYLW